MKWSWRVGQVAGIGIYIHATFLILIAWLALRGWATGQDLLALAGTVVFVLALFGCIVLHELGHALTAKRYGIRTRDITLLPIGGLARLERMPEKPMEELVVALAGPAVNLVIAAAAWGVLSLAGGFQGFGELDPLEGPFLQRLLLVNLVLFAFNLLPAFPMDGGRVLRALLATRMDYGEATQRAASVGQAMALMFGLVGLLANPFLIFIALFVWIGAAAEAAMVQIKSALQGIPVAEAMVTDFDVLAPRDPLGRGVELTLAGSQRDFPVVEGGVVRGVLTQDALVHALAQGGLDVPVADVMQPSGVPADAHDMLDAVLMRLEEAPGRIVPITRAGRLVGIVTPDNVSEFVQFQAALGGRRRRVASAARV